MELDHLFARIATQTLVYVLSAKKLCMDFMPGVRGVLMEDIFYISRIGMITIQSVH